VLAQQPRLQHRQGDIRMGRDVFGQGNFLHRRELARPVAAPGLALTSPVRRRRISAL